MRLLYDLLLGREPEPAGLQYWIDRLAAGDDLATVHRAIALSPEVQASGGSPRGTRAAAYRVDRDDDYRTWLEQYDFRPDLHELVAIERIAALPERPLVSVVLAARPGAAPRADLLAALRRQLNPDWELLAPASPGEGRPPPRDARLRPFACGPDADLAMAVNAALAAARGGVVALLRTDQQPRPHWLWLVAEAFLARPELELLYADDDQATPAGLRRRPRFKPAWDPDRFRADPYVEEGAAFRTATVRALGGYRSGLAGWEHFDLVLRLADRVEPDRVRHLPYVLLSDPAPAADSQAESPAEARARALDEHLERAYESDAAVGTSPGGAPRPIWRLPDPVPLVSLIVPTRDQAALLRRCLESVLRARGADALEILVVDNRSGEPATHAYLGRLAADPRVRILRDEAPFNFAAIVNRAAAEARCSACSTTTSRRRTTAGWPSWRSSCASGDRPAGWG